MAYGFNQQVPFSTQPPQSAPQQVLPNQNVQPLFPQPQGNVYNINSTLEVANVPVGAGMSIALCMPENTMFIKTLQNGNPMFYPYKILPYSNEANSASQPSEESKDNIFESLNEKVDSCVDRIAALEKVVRNKKKGVDFDI